MQIRTTFRQLTVEHDGARFTFKPLRLGARLDIEAVLGELAGLSPEDGFDMLSREARAQVRRTLMEHVVGWDGVEDENGVPVPFEPALVDGFGPTQAIALFFKLFAEAHVTEEQRKNSSSQSKPAKPEPDSIAESASAGASTPAENRAPLDTAPEAASS